MKEFVLKEYTQEEYEADMKKEIEKDGLLQSVKKRCDIINEEIRELPWMKRSYIQEQMVEIMDLIRLEKGG